MTLLLAAWLHNLNPYAIRLWEGGPIRWYGLSYLLAFIIAYALVRRVARVGVSQVQPERVLDLVVALAIGVVVGGRLGYVCLYQPELLWTVYGRVPFWGLLAINEGGMASHGGMIGGLLTCFWYGRRHRISMMFLSDLLAFGAPLGLFFGRLANFVNGELYGRGPTRVGWAVKFPRELYEWSSENINALYASLPAPQSILPDQQVWNVQTIIFLLQQGHKTVIEVVEPMLRPRHPSQIYAAVLEGLVVFTVLVVVWRRPRRPGIIAGLFCIGYGGVRLINELFRQPDQEIGFQLWGLTRGQWLSVPLVLLGVLFLQIAQQRGAAPLGSWRVGPWTVISPDRSEDRPRRRPRRPQG